ncbi:hypothetical protein O7599_18920 [Streptomyces sp. WMMC500]|uniref:hypothetical protein n=1 Tax=Streptomyces sp. WMMC500 TaxID=3015154 RepID=UPI00248B1122|nr:hypothetical protein [Streptomyces sp. WMMC500]WBB57759.1 hypothetical protein O7599_18920 [Streptomyces sp. WMMC500]
MPGLTEAEEERLRRALGVIAAEAVRKDVPEAVAGAVPAVSGAVPREERARTEPSPAVRRVRRALAAAVSAAAVVAFALLSYTTLSGAGTDRMDKAGEGDDGADGQGLTLLENAACTKRLLEGTVADVEQVPHPPEGFPWVEVTLADVRWHLPPSAERRVTVRIPDPVEWNDEKPFARGEPLLVEDLGRDDIMYYRGARGGASQDLEKVRGERLRALNRAQEEDVRCPSFWVNRDG